MSIKNGKMKVRKHRKKEWWFFPPKGSPLQRGRCYRFKYKSDLMKFLNRNFIDVLNGVVRLEEDSFGASYCRKAWDVWYDRNGVVLKQTYRSKLIKISKTGKKYFAFSDKVISLMCRIGEKDVIEKSEAKKLVDLFYKRGFKDFKPTDEDWEYINGHIENGIDFFHWSDRCNWIRTKTVIEYFKHENLI